MRRVDTEDRDGRRLTFATFTQVVLIMIRPMLLVICLFILLVLVLLRLMLFLLLILAVMTTFLLNDLSYPSWSMTKKDSQTMFLVRFLCWFLLSVVSAVFPVAMMALDVTILVTTITTVFDVFFRFEVIPAGAMGRHKTDRTTGTELL